MTEVSEIIPGTRAKMRIATAIYENPGIHLTALIREVKASPNTVLDYVNKLSSMHVVKQAGLGGRKKVHIRTLFPDLSSERSVIIFSLVEEEKRLRFLEKYRHLMPYVGQLCDLLGKKAEFALIYGSYARLAADKTSDIDLLVAGGLDSKVRERIREIFATSDAELSMKIETLRQFRRNRDKPLYQNIMKEHVVVFGSFNFVRQLSPPA
ncbi:MAG: winged helix-turn-helix transcriptional regulator [Candidatus Aenigmarchaeota archaeon]|nr:winged helix-turn-helix transcriptional regulator [Candidatus Aenigmarchaeota archaeon]